MKVILYRDVLNLGEEGDICNVANGYARNYLFPQKLALPYTKGNLITLESRRNVIEQRKEQKRREALGLKEKLESEEIKFAAPASEAGRLFGSVTGSMIAEELEKLGYDIDKRRIEVPENHIRVVGEHAVRVKLYSQEEAQLKVMVEKSEK
jgi:large subunit ribosomal protein L9